MKLSARGVLPDWLADAANLTELAKGSTVWLAVTGLSRAGKTVFITALIHGLTRGGRFPVFEPLASGRIARARQTQPCRMTLWMPSAGSGRRRSRRNRAWLLPAFSKGCAGRPHRQS